MMSLSSGRQIAWRQRGAFTLVELLVVLAIALIIISLVAAGTLQVIGYQRTSNTETLIRTLMPPLNQQWKAIVDMVKNEPIPQHVQNMAWPERRSAFPNNLDQAALEATAAHELQ
jgi:prepilin-type N-terminal cleavage/methylation domain-containing protein